jgi:predicted PurR-regulated permease PerM
MKPTKSLSLSQYASYILGLLALWIILKAGLLVALFSGLMVYSLVHVLAPWIERKFNNRQARMIAVLFLIVVILISSSLGLWGLVIYLRSDAGNLHTLLQKIADMIDVSRTQIPSWVSANLPEDVEALKDMLVSALREHAGEAKQLSQEAGHLIVHLLLGMIIGSMAALQDINTKATFRPFAAALAARLSNLAEVFHKIVFAQVRISLINTVLTGVYLALILPLAGVHLPLLKSMIAITFLAGMIPVLGNIISNIIIVIVSLTHSLQIASLSLAYMVVIHKLEYFLNARIIGGQINAKSWELLVAILVMETLFGLPGLVAAPVFYALVKKELRDLALV